MDWIWWILGGAAAALFIANEVAPHRFPCLWESNLKHYLYDRRALHLNFKTSTGVTFKVNNRRGDEPVDELDQVYKWAGLPSNAQDWVKTLPEKELHNKSSKLVASWRNTDGCKKTFSDFNPTNAHTETIQLEVRDPETHLKDFVGMLERESKVTDFSKPTINLLVNEDTDEIQNAVYQLYHSGIHQDLKMDQKSFISGVKTDFGTAAKFLRSHTVRNLTQAAKLWFSYDTFDGQDKAIVIEMGDSIWDVPSVMELELKAFCGEGYAPTPSGRGAKPGTLRLNLTDVKDNEILPQAPSQTNPDKVSSGTDDSPPGTKKGSTETSDNEKDGSKSKSGAGMTVLWIVLAVLGVALIGFLIWFFGFRKTEPEQALEAYEAQERHDRRRGANGRHRGTHDRRSGTPGHV